MIEAQNGNYRGAIERNILSDNSTLFLLEKGDDGKRFTLRLDRVECEAGSPTPREQTTILPSHDMNDLLRLFLNLAWNAGLRPDGFEDHTNELKATRFHLEDMRLLAKVKRA